MTEDFEREVDKVLSGELQTTTSITLVSPNDVDKYLKNEGLEQGDFDSSGWDWDFWMTYGKGEDRFELTGSGWYNNGLTFSRV